MILGEDELQSGILTVKDFSAGEQTKVPQAIWQVFCEAKRFVLRASDRI